jgi:S1-C subfamily serine protease
MASFGIVSAVGGPWRTMRGSEVEGSIRADVTFYPGFSGGPLVNAAGQMLGLNTSFLGRGAGLTVPSAAVEGVVNALLAKGRIARGYLGVGSQPVRLQAALAAQLDGGQESGLLLVGVEQGSPADTAGLMVGDILVRLDGRVMADTDDLQRQLGPASVGTTVTVTVLRGGERRDLPLVIGERS